MTHRPAVPFLSAVLAVALLAGPALAGSLAVSGEGWRLHLPDGFQAAPASRGKELQTRIQSLVSSSGLALSGEPSARCFLRFGTDVPSTLVVLRYRVPEGAGTPNLDPKVLSAAWDVAVGASGRQAVRDVRHGKLSGLHDGVHAALHEAGRGGVTSVVRLAMATAHEQLIVLAYDAPSGTDLEHTAVWSRVLASLRIVQPGVDWMLYLTYGGIIAGGLFLLLFGWWAVSRPRRGPRHPSLANPLGESGIRVADGMGLYDPAPDTSAVSSVADPTPRAPAPAEGVGLFDTPEPDSILTPRPDAPPREVAIPADVPTMGESWDPSNDPAFAEPEEEAPLRPQLDYGSASTAQPAAPPPPEPTGEARRAPEPPPAPPAPVDEATDQAAKDADSKLRISRNLDFIS